MTQSRLSREPEVTALVAGHMSETDNLKVVHANLEGQAVLLGLQLDEGEHARRLDAAIGAVRSRGLLHALWELPAGMPWPTSRLSADDIDTLHGAPEGVVVGVGGHIRRVYQPPGNVRAVALLRTRLAASLTAVSQLPPILRRYAIATNPTKGDPAVTSAAQQVGVGTSVVEFGAIRTLNPAAPAQRGVPHVYRWWIAELAYEALLQPSDH